MGLFDTIHVSADEASDLSLVCPEGHAMTNLQTKSLACAMDHFMIYEGRLYCYADHNDRRYRTGEERYLTFDRRLRVERQFLFPSSDITHTIFAGGFCTECEPVYIERPSNSFRGDLVDERAPSLKFEIEFNLGAVQHVARIAGDTRGEFVQRLREREGFIVFDDDDPLVVAHKAARRRRRERRLER